MTERDAMARELAEKALQELLWLALYQAEQIEKLTGVKLAAVDELFKLHADFARTSLR